MNSGEFFFYALLFLIGALGLLVYSILWFSGTWARIEERRERAVLDSMPHDLTTCPSCKELHDRGSFFCSVKCEKAFYLIHHEPVTILGKNHLPHGGGIQSRASMPSPGAPYPAAHTATAVGFHHLPPPPETKESLGR